MKRVPIKGSSILVTGGAGFIGSHLVDKLFHLGAREVVVMDNMFLGSERNLESALEKGVILYKEDLELDASLKYILNNHTIDIVFNCATKALNYSFINPKNAFDTNVKGILNLLECQKEGKFKTLVHFSTSEVYGSAVYEPMDELHPMNPTTTYAGGKAAADLALKTYVNMFGLDDFIVRPFNNYGPRQNYQGYMAGVIPQTALKILKGMPPEIHGTGDQTRDFIYVHDTVDAIVKLYSTMEPGDSINISSDGQISIRKLITLICDQLNYGGEVLSKRARQADVLCHNASNSKIKKLIEYQLTPIEVGLRTTLNWYQELLSDQTS